MKPQQKARKPILAQGKKRKKAGQRIQLMNKRVEDELLQKNQELVCD